MGNGPVIMIIGTECPTEWEEEWNKYYNEKHLPEMFRFKGVKKAARYKIKPADEPIKLSKGERSSSAAPYIAIYEFESWEAIKEYNTSQIRMDVVEDWNKNWTPRGAKIVSRTFYEPIKTWVK